MGIFMHTLASVYYILTSLLHPFSLTSALFNPILVYLHIQSLHDLVIAFLNLDDFLFNCDRLARMINIDRLARKIN